MQKKEEDYTLNYNIVGLKLCIVAYLFPVQSEPPYAGVGLSHDLDRVHVPLPHVMEHVLHVPHIPHLLWQIHGICGTYV
jgi:hypothetical protein